MEESIKGTMSPKAALYGTVPQISYLIPFLTRFGRFHEIELEATTNHHGQSPRPHFHSTLQQWVNLFFPPGHHKPSPDLQNPHKTLLEFLLTTPNAA